MNIFKLLISALAAWAVGLALVVITLYLSNNGADLTLHDFMGFGMFIGFTFGLGFIWSQRPKEAGLA
ncbi:MAG TPA: hypothetical protein VEW46_18890 [Pyrinomonadaceae bacterium]|nr:hypothetical protein [Pyrinomonadaceae bacterium]